MKFFIKLITVLFLLLIIVTGCFYLYISSNYIIAPLTKMVKDETGIELSIETIDYNPLYPDIVLLKKVSADTFFYADQIYIEFDYKKILDRQLYIRDIEIINVKADLDKLPAIKNLGNLVTNIYLEKLKLKNLDVSSKKWSADSSIIEIKNFNFYDNTGFNNFENLYITAFAEKIKYDNLIIHDVNTIAHITPKKIKLQEFQGNYKDASINGSLALYPSEQITSIEKLQVRNLDLFIDDKFTNFINEWKLYFKNLTLENCSIHNQNQQLFLDGVDLEVGNLNLINASIEKVDATGTIESLRHGEVIAYNLAIDMNRITTEHSINLLTSGKLFNGSFEIFAKYYPQKDKLVVTDISGNSFRIHNDGVLELKNSLEKLPFDEFNINLVDLTGIVYDSLDENNPVLLRNGSIFIDRIKYSKNQLMSSSKNSHIEIDADELSFPYINLTNMNLDFRLNSTGKITIKHATADVNEGKLNIIGTYNFDSNKYEIEAKGSDIGFNILNLIIGRNDKIGITSFDLSILGELFSDISQADGWISLSNALYSNFDISKIVDKRYPTISQLLQEASNETQNLLINKANIELKYTEKGQLIEGILDTVRTKYKINGILRNNIELQLLNKNVADEPKDTQKLSDTIIETQPISQNQNDNTSKDEKSSATREEKD